MAARPHTLISPEEYLRRERASEHRSEYYAGVIYVVADASEQHNLIAGNTLAALHSQLRRRQCTIYPSDMRVYVPLTGLYTYPDISVVCGQAVFMDSHRDTLLNPMLIIEVLSPTTERYDRGKKFQNYRTLESLQEYILIEQDAVQIERYVHVRQSNGQWSLNEANVIDDSVELETIQCTLVLEDVYEKVEFDQGHSRLPSVL